METLLAKLALATTILLAMLAQLQSPALGGAVSLENKQESYYQINGKYEYVKETPTANGSYEIHELLYPNGKRGYQIFTKTIKNMEMASGTTPKTTIDVFTSEPK